MTTQRRDNPAYPVDRFCVSAAALTNMLFATSSVATSADQRRLLRHSALRDSGERAVQLTVAGPNEELWLAAAGEKTAPGIAILVEYSNNVAPQVDGLADYHEIGQHFDALSVETAPFRLLFGIIPAVEDSNAARFGSILRDTLTPAARAVIVIGVGIDGVRGASQAGLFVRIGFHGKAAHAAVAPERGINALEAALQTVNLFNAVRQHLRPEVQANYVIPRGGSAANIVPDEAVLEYWLRAPGPVSLGKTVQALRQCAEAAASAANATLAHWDETPRVDNFLLNETLATLANGAAFAPPPPGSPDTAPPTLAGTLSHQVPVAYIGVNRADAAATIVERLVRGLATNPDTLNDAHQELGNRLSRQRDMLSRLSG